MKRSKRVAWVITKKLDKRSSLRDAFSYIDTPDTVNKTMIREKVNSLNKERNSIGSVKNPADVAISLLS